jgi:arsenite methyltransferase
MDTRIIKEAVQDSYGAMAKQRAGGMLTKLFACCDPNTLAKKVSQKVGYSTQQIQDVPENANMGLGCGNPLALASIKPGDTVLDLGSGAGFDCFLAAPLVGTRGRVIGLDLTDEMLALARQNKKRGDYEQVEFIKGDIEDIPLPDASVDLVISNCVINLSTAKSRVFQEAYRVLRPDGEMSISDIVLLGELPAFIRNSVEGHIACLAGAEKWENYVSYAREAGFKKVKIESKTSFPLELVLTDPIAQKIIRANDLSEQQIKEVAALISSVSLRATKSKRCD